MKKRHSGRKSQSPSLRGTALQMCQSDDDQAWISLQTPPIDFQRSVMGGVSHHFCWHMCCVHHTTPLEGVSRLSCYQHHHGHRPLQLLGVSGGRVMGDASRRFCWHMCCVHHVLWLGVVSRHLCCHYNHHHHQGHHPQQHLHPPAHVTSALAAPWRHAYWQEVGACQKQ